MGAWNATPFGNDTALDWLGELQNQANGSDFILQALRIDLAEFVDDADLAEELIAVCAVVSAGATEPIGRCNQEVKAWIIKTGFVPTDEMLELAKNILLEITKSSELKELWEESDSLKSWQNHTLKLLQNIEIAQQQGLPKREPKTKRVIMPKLLYKLLEFYQENPTNQKARQKIREKVLAIQDPNKADNNSNYLKPIELVSRYGLMDEFKLLIEKGAKFQSNIDTIFCHACLSGNIEFIDYILTFEPKIFMINHRDPTNDTHPISQIMYRQMEVVGIVPKSIGYEYCPTLFSVASLGLPKVADYLINLGASLFDTDLNDRNLMHYACQGGNIDMLDYLFDKGLDLNKQNGRTGDAPIHFAVRYHQTEAVKWLLEHGAEVNIIEAFEGQVNQWHNTPLDIAQDKEIVNLLKSYGGKHYSEL